jgi:hypothetical protein
MAKIKLSRKVLAKEGVDEEGKPLENMELYADVIEYDLPEGLKADNPRVVAAMTKDVSELIEKLFEVKVDVVEEDEHSIIIPDKTLKLPPGFKAARN